MSPGPGITDGWLREARRVPSPNCDERPEGVAIDLLVVHAISLPPGEFGGPWIEHLFCNCLDPWLNPYFAELEGLKVSAHALIRRDGKLIQFVPFHLRAWHAGVSAFQERERCNDFSIGIELEGEDERPYEPAQYQALADLSRRLMRTFPGITPQRIVGHSDIAPGRKTDPGPAFDWGRFLAFLSPRKK